MADDDDLRARLRLTGRRELLVETESPQERLAVAQYVDRMSAMTRRACGVTQYVDAGLMGAARMGAAAMGAMGGAFRDSLSSVRELSRRRLSEVRAKFRRLIRRAESRAAAIGRRITTGVVAAGRPQLSAPPVVEDPRRRPDSAWCTRPPGALVVSSPCQPHGPPASRVGAAA